MSFRGKAAALAVYGLFVMAVAISGQSRTQPNANLTFLGWTNMGRPAGPHAVYHWSPPSPSKLSKNFFIFQFYMLKFDYVYTDPAGQTNTGSDHAFIRSNQPDTVYVTVPANAGDFHVVRVEAWKRTSWDNVQLPFNSPTDHIPVALSSISDQERQGLQLLRGKSMAAQTK